MLLYIEEIKDFKDLVIGLVVLYKTLDFKDSDWFVQPLYDVAYVLEKIFFRAFVKRVQRR